MSTLFLNFNEVSEYSFHNFIQEAYKTHAQIYNSIMHLTNDQQKEVSLKDVLIQNNIPEKYIYSELANYKAIAFQEYLLTSYTYEDQYSRIQQLQKLIKDFFEDKNSPYYSEFLISQKNKNMVFAVQGDKNQFWYYLIQYMINYIISEADGRLWHSWQDGGQVSYPYNVIKKLFETIETIPKNKVDTVLKSNVSKTNKKIYYSIILGIFYTYLEKYLNIDITQIAYGNIFDISVSSYSVFDLFIYYTPYILFLFYVYFIKANINVSDFPTFFVGTLSKYFISGFLSYSLLYSIYYNKTQKDNIFDETDIKKIAYSIYNNSSYKDSSTYPLILQSFLLLMFKVSSIEEVEELLKLVSNTITKFNLTVMVGLYLLFKYKQFILSDSDFKKYLIKHKDLRNLFLLQYVLYIVKNNKKEISEDDVPFFKFYHNKDLRKIFMSIPNIEKEFISTYKSILLRPEILIYYRIPAFTIDMFSSSLFELLYKYIDDFRPLDKIVSFWRSEYRLSLLLDVIHQYPVSQYLYLYIIYLKYTKRFIEVKEKTVISTLWFIDYMIIQAQTREDLATFLFDKYTAFWRLKPLFEIPFYGKSNIGRTIINNISANLLTLQNLDSNDLNEIKKYITQYILNMEDYGALILLTIWCFIIDFPINKIIDVSKIFPYLQDIEKISSIIKNYNVPHVFSNAILVLGILLSEKSISKSYFNYIFYIYQIMFNSIIFDLNDIKIIEKVLYTFLYIVDNKYFIQLSDKQKQEFLQKIYNIINQNSTLQMLWGRKIMSSYRVTYLYENKRDLYYLLLKNYLFSPILSIILQDTKSKFTMSQYVQILDQIMYIYKEVEDEYLFYMLFNSMREGKIFKEEEVYFLLDIDYFILQQNYVMLFILNSIEAIIKYKKSPEDIYLLASWIQTRWIKSSFNNTQIEISDWFIYPMTKYIKKYPNLLEVLYKLYDIFNITSFKYTFLYIRQPVSREDASIVLQITLNNVALDEKYNRYVQVQR